MEKSNVTGYKKRNRIVDVKWRDFLIISHYQYLISEFLQMLGGGFIVYE